jgi:hypothetical protein
VLAIWWEISYPLVEVTLAEWNVRVESSELPFFWKVLTWEEVLTGLVGAA